MTRLRLAAVARALLIASNARADLKTYDIDPQYQQEIYAALKNILMPQGQPTQGRVELLPSGQILVNAAPETLEQVEQVLQAIRARPVAAASRVDLHYWAVLGSRATAANPPGTAPPSSLNEVLTELRRVHGDLQFRVLGTAALTTQSGQRGEIGGTTLHVDQTTFVQGETLNAEIELLLKAYRRTCLSTRSPSKPRCVAASSSCSARARSSAEVSTARCSSSCTGPKPALASRRTGSS
jgi:hypothetical protein